MSLCIFEQKYMITVASTCETPLNAPDRESDMARYLAGTISTRYGRIIVSASVTPATEVSDSLPRSHVQFQNRPKARAPMLGLLDQMEVRIKG
jgi:hypothetical protein